MVQNGLKHQYWSSAAQYGEGLARQQGVEYTTYRGCQDTLKHRLSTEGDNKSVFSWHIHYNTKYTISHTIIKIFNMLLLVYTQVDHKIKNLFKY